MRRIRRIMEMVPTCHRRQHGLSIVADRESIRLADHIHGELVSSALRVPVQFNLWQEDGGNASAMAVLAETPGTGSRQVHVGSELVFVPAENLPQRLLRVECSF